MSGIDLQLPSRLQPAPGLARVRLKELHRRVQQLPLGSPMAAGSTLETEVGELNGLDLRPEHRYQALLVLQRGTEDCLDGLVGQYSGANLPLGTRRREAFELARRLCTALAQGYRLIVHQALGGGTGRSRPELVGLAAYMALRQLSRLLLEGYRVYEDEPAGVWGLVNQIYLSVERMDDPNRVLPLRGADSGVATVGFAFRRIHLLALADPYRLLQGEAGRVFGLLRRWAQGCELVRASDQEGSGRPVIDLRADAPARFRAPGEGVGADAGGAGQLRGLQLEALLRAMGRKAMEAENLLSGGMVRGERALELRLEQDLLERLARAWGDRRHRREDREACLGTVRVAVSLAACHHHLAGGEPFLPDREEQRIREQRAPQESDGWELVPLDVEPWRSDRGQMNLTVDDPDRTGRFERDEITDIWSRVYTQRKSVPGGREPRRAPRDKHPTEPWSLRNRSVGGANLYCEPERGLKVRVGEVVALRTPREIGHSWELAFVRWLRVHDQRSLEIGLALEPGKAVPVAVRAVEGRGKGTGYRRALTVQDANGEDEAILLPVGIYDTGSELVLLHGGRLDYIRLGSAATATGSVARFSFTRLEPPPELLPGAGSRGGLSSNG